jgi:ring-1,2-phenylacetyl-CoA epoxidase subunit PaaE
VLNTEPDSTCTLIYGNRGVERTMFRRELEDLRARHPARLRIEHHLSGESAPDSPGIHHGRIDAAALRRHLTTGLSPTEIDQWLLCGPSGLVEDARAVLEEHGVDPDRVHTEVFHTVAAIPTLRRKIPADAVAEVCLTLNARSSDFTMRPAGETILDAAMRQRDDLPYSCRSGTCGDCRARICAGEVDMVDEPHMALDADEIADGLVLTCLAHPISDRVVVNYDTTEPSTAPSSTARSNTVAQ